MKYANADYRVFEFVDPRLKNGFKRGDGKLELAVWEDTAGPGGGMGRSPRGKWKEQDYDFPVGDEVDGTKDLEYEGLPDFPAEEEVNGTKDSLSREVTREAVQEDP